MTEANGKLMSNLDLSTNPEKARKTLFSHLDFSLTVCRAKAEKKKALNADRQRWIRLLVLTVETYSKMLADVELEDLCARVEKLEQNKPGGVSI